MAHCPKCGRGKLPKARDDGPKRCRHCGPLRQVIFRANFQTPKAS